MWRSDAPHIPVMLPEVLATLQPKDDETYVDATFGAGGYTRALLEAAECRVIALDRDPSVRVIADELCEQYEARFCFLAGCFSQMISLLASQGIERVDGIVMDIGVSSMQIDQAERGFSFSKDGPLDMRQSQEGMTAAEVVNTMAESELADILYRYGEEKKSRFIAKAIVRKRAEKPFETTTELASLIEEVMPRRKGKRDEIHPATRSFQALRIYVNRELDELEEALEASESLLAQNGRLVVVSFHSLEDRIVKQFLKEKSGNVPSVSRHIPDISVANRSWPFSLPERKPRLASDEEVSMNARSRSAKLRWAVRQRGEGQAA